MNIDTYTFFQTVLAGFMLVWSFRNFSHSRNHISDFEYLGFSSIWGILIGATFYWFFSDQPQLLLEMSSNPFVSGIVLSLFGVIFGFIAGKLVKLFRI